MEEYGLSLRDMYSTMDDDLLDSMVSRTLTLFPNPGYKMVHGYLSSEGVRVQRYRIRNSLHRLDPMRQSLRRVTAIRRRACKVASLLALWHIDGNHKLIRWRFVIHGGVDGYSRTVIYLTANTDNLSETVLVAFRKAVEDWGLPSRVRGDMGVENRDVASFMLEHLARGPGRGSFITGRSVHNTRIERLWRDVYTGVLATFYNVFMHLESIGVLDTLDEVDVFCLHMTYLPKINASLQKFQETWNHHKIRSAGNKTPVQLFMLGMQDIAYQNGVVAKEYFEDLNETSAAAFGIDNEESLTFEQEENAVNIPHSDVTVTSEQRRHIMSLTAGNSDAFDFDSYVQVRNYLKVNFPHVCVQKQVRVLRKGFFYILEEKHKDSVIYAIQRKLKIDLFVYVSHLQFPHSKDINKKRNQTPPFL